MTIEQILQKIQLILSFHQPFEGSIFDRIVFYYELQTLIKLTQQIEQGIDNARLTEFLSNHFLSFRSTPLSYTALPRNQTNLLLMEIAQYLSPESPLSVLMPGVALESFHDDFPTLSGIDLDLSYICQTHILSPEFNILIPISLLQYWDLLFPEKPLPNPYYDFELMDKSAALIQKSSIESLLNHSKQTRQLLDASTHHQTLCDNQTHLYAKLHQLMRHLLINSSIGGLGNELNAGADVYSAIINFNQYYQLLDASKKEQIPELVRQEIETIIELSTNPYANQSATENLETCVYSRRTKLIKVVEEHHAVLCRIDVHESLYPSLIEESLTSFEMQKKQLHLSIAQKQYTDGYEKVAISLELLDKLNIQVQLDSFEDLLHIVQLDEADLENLLVIEPIKSQFLLHLNTIENLVEFSFSTPINKFKIIFSALADELASNLNYNAHFFGFWLSLLPEHLGQAILTAFEGNWNEIINNGNDFSQFLHNLSQTQKKWVMNFFLNMPPFFVKNGDDISLICRNIEREERDLLFQKLNGHFFELIENASELGKVLNCFTQEQGEIIFSSVLSKFPELITDSHDFNYCMAYLNQTQKQIIMSLSIHHFQNIIRSGADLRLVLENFNPEDQNLVWAQHKSLLRHLIISGSDFSEACYYLTESQIFELIESFSDSIIDIISSGSDFRDAITFLNEKHKKILFNYCKPHLVKLIKSNSDFSQMMQFLDFPQRRECFDIMKITLFKLVAKPQDIHHSMTYLTPPQSTEFIELSLGKLHSFMDSITAYNQFTQNISTENREILFKAFKSHLEDLVHSGFDFWSLCENLTYDNRLNFLEFIKPRLTDIIKTPADLGHVLRCFYMNHQYELGLHIWKHLGQIFKSADDFIAIMKHLPKTSLSSRFFECYVFNLIQLCHSPKDFILIESNLNDSNKELFFELMAARIPKIVLKLDDLKYLLIKINFANAKIQELMGKLATNLIFTAQDFNQVIDGIQPGNIFFLINHLFPKLHHLIDNSRNFKLVFNLLPSDKSHQLFEKINLKLPFLIENAIDFSYIMSFLSSEQKQKVFLLTGERLFDLVHNVCQFAVLLEHLEYQHKKQLLMTNLDKLSRLINNPKEFTLVMYYFDAPERVILFKQLKQKMIFAIEDSNDLGVCLKYLPEDEFIILCKAIKHKFSYFLQNNQDYINILYSLNLEQIQLLSQHLEEELLEPIQSPTEFEQLLLDFSAEQKSLMINLFKYKLSIWLLSDFESHHEKICQWLGSERAILSFWTKDNSRIHQLMGAFNLTNQQEVLLFFIKHSELFFTDVENFMAFIESFPTYEIKLLMQHPDVLLSLQKICQEKEEYQMLQQTLESKVSLFSFFIPQDQDADSTLAFRLNP